MLREVLDIEPYLFKIRSPKRGGAKNGFKRRHVNNQFAFTSSDRLRRRASRLNFFSRRNSRHRSSPFAVDGRRRRGFRRGS